MLSNIDNPVFYDISNSYNNLNDVRYGKSDGLTGSLIEKFRSSSRSSENFTNEPTFLTFAIVFNDNTLFDSTSNIGDRSKVEKFTQLSESPLFDKSAWAYLMGRAHFMEAYMLKYFCDTLQTISMYNPWFFKDLSGLKDLWKANTDPSKPFKGDNKVLKINTLESLDLSITYLADLYRSFTYDMIYMREILPDNLRWFCIDVYVGEIRNLKFSSVYNPVNSNSTIKVTSNSWIDDFKTYLHFRCHQCEFDFSESVPFDSLSVEKAEMASNKFAIKVGWWEELSYYDSQRNVSVIPNSNHKDYSFFSKKGDVKRTNPNTDNGQNSPKYDENFSKSDLELDLGVLDNESKDRHHSSLDEAGSSKYNRKNELENDNNYKNLLAYVDIIHDKDNPNRVRLSGENKNSIDEKSVDKLKLKAEEYSKNSDKIKSDPDYAKTVNAAESYIERGSYNYYGAIDSLLNKTENRIKGIIDLAANIKNSYNGLKSGDTFKAIGESYSDYFKSIRDNIKDRVEDIKEYSKEAFNPTDSESKYLPYDSVSSVATGVNHGGETYTPSIPTAKVIEYGSHGSATSALGKNSAEYRHIGKASTSVEFDNDIYSEVDDPSESVEFNNDIYSEVDNPSESVEFNNDIYLDVDDPSESVEFNNDIYSDVDDPSESVEFNNDIYSDVDDPSESVEFNNDIYSEVDNPSESVEFNNDIYKSTGTATDNVEFNNDVYKSVGDATNNVDFTNNPYGKVKQASANVEFNNDVYGSTGNATEKVEFNNDVYKSVGDATNNVEFNNNGIYDSVSSATTKVDFANNVYDSEGKSTRSVDFSNDNIYKEVGSATKKVNFDNDVYGTIGSATNNVDFTNSGIYDSVKKSTKNVEFNNDVYGSVGTASTAVNFDNDLNYGSVEQPTISNHSVNNKSHSTEATSNPAKKVEEKNNVKYYSVNKNSASENYKDKNAVYNNSDIIGISETSPARSLFENAWRGSGNKS